MNNLTFELLFNSLISFYIFAHITNKDLLGIRGKFKRENILGNLLQGKYLSGEIST